VRLATFVVVAAVLALAYFTCSSALARAGYLAPNLAFFGEKSALALHGLPPRLVNVGFVYPPLTFLLQLPFGDPLIGGAAIAGVAIAGVLAFLDPTRVTDPLVRRIAQVYVICSPVMLFVAVEDPGALLFAVLLAASVHFMTRFFRADFSLDLFIGSTLLGLTFFLDFRSVILVLAIVPAAALPRWRRSPAEAISVALTIAVPTLFFVLAWSYVNAIFLGDPFAYAHGRNSLFRTFPVTPDLLAAAWDPIATLRTAAVVLAISLPVTLPYLVGGASLRHGRSAYVVPARVVYATPIIFVVFAIFIGLYRPTVGLLALFILVVLFSLDAIAPSPWFAASLAISFVASAIAPFASPAADERALAAALIGRAPLDATMAPFRQISAHLGTRGAILADDALLYPLVYVSGMPERFVLPYQYEYASALSNPHAAVQYVVVARRPEDTVYALYPSVEFGRLPGFHEIDRLPGYLVFERDDQP
jgi:hypothetical protein